MALQANIMCLLKFPKCLLGTGPCMGEVLGTRRTTESGDKMGGALHTELEEKEVDM